MISHPLFDEVQTSHGLGTVVSYRHIAPEYKVEVDGRILTLSKDEVGPKGSSIPKATTTAKNSLSLPPKNGSNSLSTTTGLSPPCMSGVYTPGLGFVGPYIPVIGASAPSPALTVSLPVPKTAADLSQPTPVPTTMKPASPGRDGGVVQPAVTLSVPDFSGVESTTLLYQPQLQHVNPATNTISVPMGPIESKMESEETCVVSPLTLAAVNSSSVTLSQSMVTNLQNGLRSMETAILLLQQQYALQQQQIQQMNQLFQNVANTNTQTQTQLQQQIQLTSLLSQIVQANQQTQSQQASHFNSLQSILTSSSKVLQGLQSVQTIQQQQQLSVQQQQQQTLQQQQPMMSAIMPPSAFSTGSAAGSFSSLQQQQQTQSQQQQQQQQQQQLNGQSQQVPRIALNVEMLHHQQQQQQQQAQQALLLSQQQQSQHPDHSQMHGQQQQQQHDDYSAFILKQQAARGF